MYKEVYEETEDTVVVLLDKEYLEPVAVFKSLSCIPTYKKVVSWYKYDNTVDCDFVYKIYVLND